MHPYSVTLPRTIFSGVNALDNLHQIARNSHKIAIFTDTIIMNLGLVDQITDILNQASAETMIISDLPPEPTCAQVQRCVDIFNTFGADLIVAVGGGSVMDTAKLASLLASSSYTVSDLLHAPVPEYETSFHRSSPIPALLQPLPRCRSRFLPKLPILNLHLTSLLQESAPVSAE